MIATFFGKKILEYKDELLKDLNTLLSFESIDGENDDECRAALNFILKRAEDFGLNGEITGKKSGHVTLGSGGKLCETLTHLDVVPAGTGWSVPPYALTRKNGRLYGRGIDDDKGAALVTLYSLRALKDAGITGKNTLRCVFGIAEETGMDDMLEYFETQPLPDMAFTPDSDYGICFAEKGILHVEVSTPVNNATVLSQFHSGKALNAVPELAYVMLDSSDYDEHSLLRLADASDGNFEFKYTIDGLMIISRGRAAHACEPEKGYNAAAALADLISNVYTTEQIGEVCSFIDYALNKETNGRSMGLKMSDSVSGALTVALSRVEIENDTARAVFDIRYPVTVKGEAVLEQFKKVAQNSSLTVKVLGHELPLYAPRDSELVALLSKAYESVTGEKPELYSTGGGTYARMLGGRGVAFGPAFKGDNVHMHNADESMNEENFFTHAQICLEAMHDMFVG